MVPAAGKCVRIPSFSGPYFSTFDMRENTD